MPPITSDNVTLQCPRADGSGFAFEIYSLAQFDDQRLPVNLPLTVAVNSQPTIVSGTIGVYDVNTQVFTPNAAGKDLKVQTIAPKPSNLSGSLLQIRDGRQNPDGSPVQFTVNVTYATPPAVPPTIERVSKQPIVTTP